MGFNEVYDYLVKNNIQTPTPKEELNFVFDMARGVSLVFKHNANYVELGTMHGATAIIAGYAMQMVNKENSEHTYKVTAVDLCVQCIEENTRRNIEKANSDLGINVEFIVSDDLLYLSNTPDNTINGLFIDSYHEYNHVLATIQVSQSKLTASALCFGHDYMYGCIDVVRAVDDWRENNRGKFFGHGLYRSIWWQCHNKKEL